MDISQTLETLKKTYSKKTELHCHTSGASRCSAVTPEMLVRVYGMAGYSTVVFTNHFLFGELKNDSAVKEEARIHIADYEKGKKEGEKIGVEVLFATELRFEGYNDYLFYGPEPDFYMNLDFKKTRTLEDFSSEYRNDGNLLFQAHPFRNGMILAPLNCIDGIETFNFNPVHNSRLGVAAMYAEENGLLSICGSDFHHIEEGQACALCTEKTVKTSSELIEILKSKDHIWTAGEATIIF